MGGDKQVEFSFTQRAPEQEETRFLEEGAGTGDVRRSLGTGLAAQQRIAAPQIDNLRRDRLG